MAFIPLILCLFMCISNSSHSEENFNHLEHLDQFDKTECLQILADAELDDLWNAILTAQADWMFPKEAKLLSKHKFWQESKNVLDLGSGNGVYLHKLFTTFPGKNYKGVEKQLKSVLVSEKNFSGPQLHFIEGNAEVFNEGLKDQFDVVFCRLVLQHLQNPKLALEHASEYLKEGGYVVILDTFDHAHPCPFPTLDKATIEHNEKNKKENLGNRQITIELFNEIKNKTGKLSDLYEVVYANFDEQGQIFENVLKFEGLKENKVKFTISMIYLSLLIKSWNIPVDLSTAYDELHVVLEDDQTTTSNTGIHYLFLKKL